MKNVSSIDFLVDHVRSKMARDITDEKDQINLLEDFTYCFPINKHLGQSDLIRLSLLQEDLQGLKNARRFVS